MAIGAFNQSLTHYRAAVENYTPVRELSRIVDGLYLGNWLDAKNKDSLVAAGIKYIVNATRDVLDFYPGDFTYYRIPISDHPAENIAQYLVPAADFIESALPYRTGTVLETTRGNVFVHCHAGISRSASIVIAYLILKRHMSYEDAVALTRRGRGIIRPNPGFQRALEQL
jgi:protein-tyrosine phosphatase